jgi:peptidoglycan hydrolase-like protein with peptidoglycan-binding domain
MKMFQKYLDMGSKGPAVVVLQLLLKAAGYNSSAIVPDGDYGEQTAAGVRELQKHHGIEVDGHFGPDTRKALMDFTTVNVNDLDAELFIGETLAVGPDESGPDDDTAHQVT